MQQHCVLPFAKAAPFGCGLRTTRLLSGQTLGTLQLVFERIESVAAAKRVAGESSIEPLCGLMMAARTRRVRPSRTVGGDVAAQGLSPVSPKLKSDSEMR